MNEEIVLLNYEIDTLNGQTTKLLHDCESLLTTALSAMPKHPHVTTERIELVLAMIDAYLKKGNL
jgi:hypothetical protein